MSQHVFGRGVVFLVFETSTTVFEIGWQRTTMGALYLEPHGHAAMFAESEF